MEDLTQREREFNYDLTSIANIYKTIEVDDNGQASTIGVDITVTVYDFDINA